MNNYQNLATLLVRWMAVVFFALALISVVFAGSMGVGSMMMGSGGPMPAGTEGMSDHMAGMGGWMWWGPTLVFVLVGFLLWAVSRPVGGAMAAGLEAHR